MPFVRKYHHEIRNREQQSRPFEASLVDVEITPSDKGRLERFCREETKYYNRLVEGFSPLMRTSTEFIADLNESWNRLFGHVAETSNSLRQYWKQDITQIDLSGFLQEYKDTLSHLTEKQIIFSEIAAAPMVLLPLVKRNMAIEFLHHYQAEAKQMLAPANKVAKDDSIYGRPIELLEQVDFDSKRHLQIPKTCLQVSWDTVNEATHIKCGYAASPIVVPNINLVSNSNWNYIILSQKQRIHISEKDPWIINVRKLHSINYLLRCYDRRRIIKFTID